MELPVGLLVALYMCVKSLNCSCSRCIYSFYTLFLIRPYELRCIDTFLFLDLPNQNFRSIVYVRHHGVGLVVSIFRFI